MPAQAQQPAQQGEGIWPTVKSVVNGIAIFFLIQSATKYITGTGQQQTTVTTSSGAAVTAGPPGAWSDGQYYPQQLENYAQIPQNVAPIWPEGTALDMSVYLSETLSLPALKSVPSQRVLQEENIALGDWSDARSVSLEIPVPEGVQNNGTYFAHIFVGKHGSVLDPHEVGYDPTLAYRTVKLLTRYQPKKKEVKLKKLVGGSKEEKEEEVVPEPPKERVVASYWHANLTLDLVHNGGVLQWPTLPTPLRQHVVTEYTGARDKSGVNGWYYPIVFANDFWLLKDHMTEINSTVKTLPLHINLNAQSYWKFQLYASMDYSFKQSASNPNTALGQSANTGAELEEFKRVLVETNIYLLGTTFFVSILHTIFEMLAFKNDISHWRNKKDNVGISVRTILANVFMQTVIFLYLVDNSDGTSWMILAGQGFGILLEAWKITRMVDVRIVPSARSPVGYRISFVDKHTLSALERETKEYDEEAFKYMYMLSIPLLAAYAVYSLLYQEHKSIYSFVITTLVGSVYAYGFLLMVPSLWINYKLKSVAHMPRKTMVYKLLNTFIDDLFAFTIKMPTLHRLATLRDDVIYVIALYQTWIYKVDYRRVNEFGQGGKEEEAVVKKDEVVEEEEKGVDKAVKASGAEGKKDATKRR